jgi:ABC-type glycerol-3-phosphate transport system permease component
MRLWIVTRGAAVLFAALSLVPFLYVVSTAFKQQTNLFQFPPDWIPNDPTLVNFERLLSDHPFVRWTLNTLFISTTVAMAKVVIDSMAGYALARLDFPGRRLVSGAFLMTVMVPIAVLIIPIFFIIRDLGILDTYWALLLPPLANPIGIMMFRGYIAAIPPELEGAAALDGAGPFRTYWHVILPLIRPGMVVVGLYTFIFQYTNFVLPLIGTDSEDLRVLTNGVATLQTPTPDYGLIAAGALGGLVPIAIVFVLLQRHFMTASLGSALKG